MISMINRYVERKFREELEKRVGRLLASRKKQVAVDAVKSVCPTIDEETANKIAVAVIKRLVENII